MKNYARNAVVCALTAAASLSASTVFAQSKVSLYGNIDLGLKFQSGQKSKGRASTEMDYATYSGFGIEGQEDLGGGLKAFFRLEHSFDASTGMPEDNRRFLNDISVIGLRGDFGTLRFGSSGNTFAIAASPDPFDGGYVGGRGNRRAGADEKWENSVAYFTPEINGFQAVLGTALAERAMLQDANGVEQARAKNPFAVTVLYNHGNLTSSLGYMQRPNKDKAYAGSATYDFNVVTAFLTVAHNDGKGNGLLVDEGKNGEPDGKRTTYNLGVAVPVGAAGSIRAKYNLGRRQITPGADTIKTQHVGLGYLHNLSLRTHLYVTGGMRKVDGKKNVRAMDMGISHSF